MGKPSGPALESTGWARARHRPGDAPVFSFAAAGRVCRWPPGRWGGPRKVNPYAALARTGPCHGDAPLHASPLLKLTGEVDGATVAVAAAALGGRGWFACRLGAGSDRGLAAAGREALEAAASGAMGRGLVGASPSEQSSRTDRVCWLRDMPSAIALRKTMDMLRAIGLTVSKQDCCGIKLTESTDGMVACYEDGGHYRPHFDCSRDALRSGSTTERILTTILYLNPGWRREDGGALRMFLPDEKAWRQVWPEMGTLVIFRADRILHEVQAARARRLALTLWHIGQERAET